MKAEANAQGRMDWTEPYGDKENTTNERETMFPYRKEVREIH
ncbi:hypothetical protein [Pseudalkalibacillus caeni]|nr:hypothetical protein [Pseudalkalibacillus caeni]